MIKLNARKKELKEMFEAMGNITTETRVKITPEGITSTMANPLHTAMLKLDLPKQAFQEYVVDEEKTIGLDLREWNRELLFERAKDLIGFEVITTNEPKGIKCNGVPTLIEIVRGKFTTQDGFEDTIEMLNPNEMRKEPKIPGLTNTAFVTITTARIKKILKKSITEVKRKGGYRRDLYIQFSVSESGEFITIAENELKIIKSKTTAEGETKISGKGSAIYSTYELLKLIQAIKDETVSMEFADDFPITITFKLLKYGTAQFLLAPRVKSK